MHTEFSRENFWKAGNQKKMEKNEENISQGRRTCHINLILIQV
jgi:hypothetical protein